MFVVYVLPVFRFNVSLAEHLRNGEQVSYIFQLNVGWYTVNI